MTLFERRGTIGFTRVDVEARPARNIAELSWCEIIHDSWAVVVYCSNPFESDVVVVCEGVYQAVTGHLV